MSKKKEAKANKQYTSEFKEEALKLAPNQYCVNFPLPPDANQWQILLRKGLSVDQYWRNIKFI